MKIGRSSDRPGPTRTFTTASSRDLHLRSAHPTLRVVIKLGKTFKKGRLSLRERTMLAKLEAQLTKKGIVHFQIELAERFVRFFEGIRVERKKPDYKELMTILLSSCPSIALSLIGKEEAASHFSSMAAIQTEQFQSKWLICKKVSTCDKSEILEKLDHYLSPVLQGTVLNPSQKSRINIELRSSFRKKRTKKRYAGIQDLWEKNSSRCEKRILPDQHQRLDGVPQHLMEPFWNADPGS